ncbi:hypothetical protein ABTZ78_17545 [Streptomyces bauhiniae]|uniref:hypothetical protein n=1 Tax=Streptomyces bauhiniae TaxID=2340725 RepID=UPI0033262DEE
MEPTNWLGFAAIVVTTAGTAWGMWVSRTKTTVKEIPADGMPDAPPQPEGTWTVSPEMYRWFEQQMKGLHNRMRTLEDDLRTARSELAEARSRGDRTGRLLSLALVHIGHQDERLRAAGIPLVPMDPELIAARDSL